MHDQELRSAVHLIINQYLERVIEECEVFEELDNFKTRFTELQDDMMKWAMEKGLAI